MALRPLPEKQSPPRIVVLDKTPPATTTSSSTSTSTTTTSTSTLQAPPVPKADVSAVTGAGGGGTNVVAAELGRVKAPWTARSQAMAGVALEAAKGKTGAAAVGAVVDAILGSKELKGAKVSCTVVSMKSGAPIVKRGEGAALNPCSNSKVVTAAYALSVLGPMHRFGTDVVRLPDGAGVGVVGRFDPTLTTDSLIEIAKRLHDEGVTHVKKLVLDDGALSGSNVPAAFSHYGDEDWEYVARPEPLSVNKAALHLSVKPGAKVGDDAVVTMDQGAFVIRCRVKTVEAGAQFKMGCDELDHGGVLERTADGKAIIDVWGTIAVDFAKGKDLVMKSPAPQESFEERLAFALAQAGVGVGEIVRGSVDKSAPRIFEHKSKPLATILETSLSTSNAFDHEMFALAAALEEKRRAGEGGGSVSLAEAAEHLEKFLRDVVGGEGTMANASGIGNDNRLRSEDIAHLFAMCANDAKLAPLLDALAHPGEKGTLKTRMLDTAAEGIFRGKTGTGDDAAALSGVMGDPTTAQGIAMSLLVDDGKGREGMRAALDAMAIALSTLVKEKRTEMKS